MARKTKTTAIPAGTPLEQAREALGAAIPRAASALVALLDAEDERIRLRSAEAILARGGITPAGVAEVYDAAREIGGGVTPEPDTERPEPHAPLNYDCPTCKKEVIVQGADGTCPHCEAPMLLRHYPVPPAPSFRPFKAPCLQCGAQVPVRPGGDNYPCTKCGAILSPRVYKAEDFEEPEAAAKAPARAESAGA